MNKQDLIGAVADATGLSRGDATRAVEGVFDTIQGALKIPTPNTIPHMRKMPSGTESSGCGCAPASFC